MDDLAKEYVISFFDRTLRSHGDRPEAVRWTAQGQIRHYECLLEVATCLEGSSILDYGCGKGDFYQFLKDRNISVHYTGFDINENLISLAKSKFPECEFRVFDAEKDIISREYDYIILCGVFNLRVQDIDKTIKSTLLTLMPHCRKALAFNALSSHDPGKSPELNYLSPGDMADFAIMHLSSRISLIHDRIPYDFTLIIRKG